MTAKPSMSHCLGCGKRLPIGGEELCAVSHTIRPGAPLCSDCGRRETSDPAWANGTRVGLLRDEAARDAPP
jgi:hypothetical protein